MKDEEEINLPAQKKRIEEALRRLDENLADGEQTVADRRARALIEGTLPSRREESLKKLEALAEGGEPTPEERYHHALQARANHDYGQARAELLLSLSEEPTNARYLAELIRVMLDDGTRREARYWIKRLERIEPKSNRTVELKIRAQR